MEFKIQFVGAPGHLLKAADKILRSRIRCKDALLRDTRAVAKAYIDEADELKRAIRDLHAGGRVQIETRSPAEVIARARRLLSITLPNRELQDAIRSVADSYVSIAEENQRLYDEFMQKHDQLPQGE